MSEVNGKLGGDPSRLVCWWKIGRRRFHPFPNLIFGPKQAHLFLAFTSVDCTAVRPVFGELWWSGADSGFYV